MTDKLRDRVDMLRRVLHHFDAHPDRWGKIEVIAEDVERLRDGHDAIERAALRQAESDPEGFTEEKTAARARAAALLASLGNRAAPYARKAGDADLRRAVDHSETEWKQMAEADFFINAAEALNRLTADLAKVSRYGIADEDLTAARKAVGAARPLAAQRDDVLAHRKGATEDLDAGYAPLVPIFDSLDELVPELVEDAEFVAGYRNARRIKGD